MSAYIVGLTGGIGSGKSAAAEYFRQHGAEIVDADAIAHELTGPHGLAMPAIVVEFGPEIAGPDGALDRAAMRQLAFADSGARQRLERILHPIIRATCDARCKAALSPYVMLVVPLLVESGIYKQRCQRLAVVDCPEETQIARVIARNGMSRTEVERIMAAQASRSQRLAAADDIIDNSGAPELLAPQIEALHSKYMDLARIG
ncbi:MAG TPA: dephospho-CoA kinase [Rhodocyclaceae bacterium]|nr:dephospho-CoA kinase [Rhodocyclaceae bacterium]